MPSMFGKDSKKKELIKRLSSIYAEIEKEFQVPPGDFPDLKEMQEKLMTHDFTKFNTLKKPLLDTVDKMLADDISRLMAMIPHVGLIFLNDTLTLLTIVYFFRNKRNKKTRIHPSKEVPSLSRKRHRLRMVEEKESTPALSTTNGL